MPRRKGSRNRGYFYRRNRGWFANDSAGHYVALTDVDGNRLRDRNTDKEVLKDAYGRYRQQRPASTITTWELAQRYLAHAEENGADSTFKARTDILYDFCTGFGRKWRESKARPKEKDRIHDGYGEQPAERLTPAVASEWLDKHPGWGKGGRRMKLQALKRMLNFGVETLLIGRNPLRGMRVPKPGARVTCINREQETVLLAVAPSEVCEAIQVLIRTGMRPNEYAKLSDYHVQDLTDRLEFHFKAEEIKTRKARIIRVADPAIVEIIRKKLRKDGPLFRNSNGTPWKVKSLSRAFLRAKNQAAKQIEFDRDCCLYSCRHTFAKRVLTGYWSGKPISIEVLSLLMGNTPEVCRANYLQWSASYTQPLWDAVG